MRHFTCLAFDTIGLIDSADVVPVASRSGSRASITLMARSGIGRLRVHFAPAPGWGKRASMG